MKEKRAILLKTETTYDMKIGQNGRQKIPHFKHDRKTSNTTEQLKQLTT